MVSFLDKELEDCLARRPIADISKEDKNHRVYSQRQVKDLGKGGENEVEGSRM